MALADTKITDLTEKATSGQDSWLHFVDPTDVSQSPEGSSYKISKINYLKEIAADVIKSAPFLGSIVPTSTPTGTGIAYWLATQNGTYTNFGGVVVNTNSLAVISRSAAGAFSISQTALDLTNYQKKSDIQAIVDVANTTNSVTGKAVFDSTVKQQSEKLYIFQDADFEALTESKKVTFRKFTNAIKSVKVILKEDYLYPLMVFEINYLYLSTVADTNFFCTIGFTRRNKDGSSRTDILKAKESNFIALNGRGVIQVEPFNDGAVFHIDIDKNYLALNNQQYIISNTDVNALLKDKIYINPNNVVTSSSAKLTALATTVSTNTTNTATNTNDIKNMVSLGNAYTPILGVEESGTGYYNKNNGVFTTFNNYKSVKFAINPNDSIYATSFVNGSLTALAIYYNSSNQYISFETTGLDTGGVTHTRTKLTIPPTAAFVGMTRSTSTGTLPSLEKGVYSPASTDLIPKIAGFMAVKVVGENLYIGSKHSSTKDLIIHFKKCMKNNLMTFFTVGTADNTGVFAMNNPDRGVTTNINVSTSDNIGPINTGSGWVGGDHLFTGNKITAQTNSFIFLADCGILNSGDVAYAKSIEIRVNNTIFNPALPNGNGDLDQVLAYEDVVYKVENGSISVTLTHSFKASASIYTYYGAQSMATGVDVFFPNGHTTNFITKASLTKLKSEFPTVNRFVQRNLTSSWYESVYILPTYGIGNKNLLESNKNIYVIATNKTYQQLISYQSATNGTVNKWTGVYNWFLPYLDDADYLIYESKYNGKDYLFIDCKTIKNQVVQLPAKYTLKPFVIKEKTASLTIGTDIDTIGLSINSTGVGSLILEF